MTNGREMVSMVSDRQDRDQFRRKYWVGNFEEYLDIVRQDPRVTRTAFQRVYDMIMSYGTYPVEGKKGLIRYRFFDDPVNDGKDGIFGLSKPLMELVNVFKSAALKYGSERRVLLLHGPVGSSKSTIARLLKQGLERYSRTEDGALYSFGWKVRHRPAGRDPGAGNSIGTDHAACARPGWDLSSRPQGDARRHRRPARRQTFQDPSKDFRHALDALQAARHIPCAAGDNGLYALS